MQFRNLIKIHIKIYYVHYQRAYVYKGPCVICGVLYRASDTTFERNHFAFYAELQINESM